MTAKEFQAVVAVLQQLGPAERAAILHDNPALRSVLLLGVSVVVLPANADTVGKVLGRDRCCGKRLSPYLVKSLQPHARRRTAQLGHQRR